MPMSQTWSYTITHIGSYVMTYILDPVTSSGIISKAYHTIDNLQYFISELTNLWNV
ncbi:hypothetical protein F383_33076 [Gossypium arboreum]|uniref:Uncharacterized protein n=1 Tax=Gossypium arboreum TaxID=29729 RepID=A0A0B0N2W3_GOSAR|nr:hypothetical protein F383_33076 [Gossypium arboreum]